MPMGGAYTVTPEKNIDAINGVSTLDLVLIQKHILGLDILDSPYKMIAADINNSNSISGADIVELRKLILGEQAEFSNNDSWRFIDKSYDFLDDGNPWAEFFPEEYEIENLEESMKIDFLGMKVGDVSGNASTSSINTSEVRSTSKPLKLIVSENQSEDRVMYSISSSNFNEVLGFQTTLNFEPNEVSFEGIINTGLDISIDNLGVTYADRGMITISWSSSEDITISDDEELFELIFRKVSDKISGLEVSSDITKTEAYFEGEISDKITLTDIITNGLSVGQNEPNPWKDQTNINFTISESGYVGFNVMDLSGKLILSRSNHYTAGDNKIKLRRADLPGAGLYLYEIYSQGEKVTKKMIILD